MGQPCFWRNTSLAHNSQKRWWPHGTSEMRASRSATRHTSQQSSLTAAVSCAVALALAQTAVDWSKLISHYLHRSVTFSLPYFVFLAFSSSAFSTHAVWCHVFQSRVFRSRIFSAPQRFFLLANWACLRRAAAKKAERSAFLFVLLLCQLSVLAEHPSVVQSANLLAYLPTEITTQTSE